MSENAFLSIKKSKIFLIFFKTQKEYNLLVSLPHTPTLYYQQTSRKENIYLSFYSPSVLAQKGGDAYDCPITHLTCETSCRRMKTTKQGSECMKKIIASIFVLLVMLSFVCCSNTQNSTDNPTDNSFSESIAESSKTVESSETTISTENSEMSDTSVPSLPEEESKTEVSIENEVSETVSSSPLKEYDEESSSSTETDEPEQTSKPDVSEAPQVSKPEESEVEDTSEPEIEPEEPQESEPEQSTPPITEPEQSEPPISSEPDISDETSIDAEPFDIDYWIEYARDYAESVGLILHESAVDCWDTPIIATPTRTNLKGDVESRLNRYAYIEEFEWVWIWAEQIGEDRYNLYIGYA